MVTGVPFSFCNPDALLKNPGCKNLIFELLLVYQLQAVWSFSHKTSEQPLNGIWVPTVSLNCRDGCVGKLQYITGFWNIQTSLPGTNTDVTFKVFSITFLPHFDANLYFSRSSWPDLPVQMHWDTAMWLADYTQCLC